MLRVCFGVKVCSSLIQFSLTQKCCSLYILLLFFSFTSLFRFSSLLFPSLPFFSTLFILHFNQILCPLLTHLPSHFLYILFLLLLILPNPLPSFISSPTKYSHNFPSTLLLLFFPPFTFVSSCLLLVLVLVLVIYVDVPTLVWSLCGCSRLFILIW